MIAVGSAVAVGTIEGLRVGVSVRVGVFVRVRVGVRVGGGVDEGTANATLVGWVKSVGVGVSGLIAEIQLAIGITTAIIDAKKTTPNAKKSASRPTN